jgi:pyridoxamine 5'-phosphate oxidase
VDELTSAVANRVRELLLGLTSLAGSSGPFEIAHAPNLPGTLFEQWFVEAVDAGVEEPHAMSLSTIGTEERPDSRVLILKDFDPTGRWAFSSSAASIKGQQLERRPVAALTFYWPRLVRSIRIRGSVATDTDAASRADFAARSVGARAVVLAGQQSAPLLDPTGMRQEIEAASARLEQQTELGAEQWRKYWVTAETVEFWQGERTRQHTRLQYLRDGDRWMRQQLQP